MNAASVRLLILDVDGVLTDGRIAPTPDGGATKSFYVQDGAAIKLWQRAGRDVAILSGRDDPAVGPRAKELGVECVHLGVSEKSYGYDAVLKETGVESAAVCYLGDDLPDLAPMARCGLPAAVANAAPAVKQAADYVTRRSGGAGAVAELVELLLRKQGLWRGSALSQS